MLAGFAVVFAAALQTATGAGLGLVAGPALLLAMASTDAIHVAAWLNLLLSLFLLPSEWRQVPRNALGLLSAGALLGIPVGAWLMHQMTIVTFQLVTGVVVIIGGLQLLATSQRGTPDGSLSRLIPAGLIAGLMTAAMAVPGPAALWGLAGTRLDPVQVRAALRGFFVAVYSATVGVHAIAGINWETVIAGTAWMLPTLVAGALLGLRIRRFASERTLRISFIVLLLGMGATLLFAGLTTH